MKHLTEEEFVIASSLLIMFLEQHKNITRGKRLRKKLISSLNKTIAIERTGMNDIPKYIKLVTLGRKVIDIARYNMKLRHVDLGKELIVNPAWIYLLVEQAHPGLLTKFNIDSNILNEYEELYKDSESFLVTKVFMNRLLYAIRLEVEKG